METDEKNARAHSVANGLDCLGAAVGRSRHCLRLGGSDADGSAHHGRPATVLELVGAGGIGFYLQQTMRAFSFQEACVVVFIVLGSVVVIDKISAKLREWLV